MRFDFFFLNRALAWFPLCTGIAWRPLLKGYPEDPQILLGYTETEQPQCVGEHSTGQVEGAGKSTLYTLMSCTNVEWY